MLKLRIDAVKKMIEQVCISPLLIADKPCSFLRTTLVLSCPGL